jgi:hypothetical protein
MFVYWAIKCYKELWRVEDRAWSGCLKSVRAEAAIKQYGSRFAEICFENSHVPRAKHINMINVMTHQG